VSHPTLIRISDFLKDFTMGQIVASLKHYNGVNDTPTEQTLDRAQLANELLKCYAVRV
jgi:hypothetical protein